MRQQWYAEHANPLEEEAHDADERVSLPEIELSPARHEWRKQIGRDSVVEHRQPSPLCREEDRAQATRFRESLSATTRCEACSRILAPTSPGRQPHAAHTMRRRSRPRTNSFRAYMSEEVMAARGTGLRIAGA